MTRDRLLRYILLLYGLALVAALVSLFGKPNLLKGKGKSARGSVAVVNIYGPIKISMSESAWNSSDADDIAKRLYKISEDDDVKAVVLRINSPGGTVAAVQEIEEQILACRKKGKIIVASLGDVAASGGYYLAAAADKIYAEPGTITGSIGVILQFPNFETLMKKVGVGLEIIKSGEHKDIGSPARALTAEERRILQVSIDDAYAQFLDAVVKGRKSTPEKIKPLADGRIFTGRQAKEAGLIDEFGGRRAALMDAKKMAGLPEDARLVTEGGRGLQGMLKNLTSHFGVGPWQALQETLQSPSLEYRWR